MAFIPLLLGLLIAADATEPHPVLSRSNRKGAAAVVVGVETYRGKLPAATHAKHDAEAFATFAQATLGIPADRIQLLTNEFASRSDIEKALSRAGQIVKAEGDVVFYFSGHGTPNTKTGEPMLVPYDADPEEVDSSALAIPGLLSKIEAMPGKEKLVFFDACFSGMGERSVIGAGKRPLVPVRAIPDARGALVVFSATTAKGTSGPSHKSEHGLFTYHLLQGLRGAADVDGDHTITAAELSNYIHRQVVEEAKEHGSEQEPVSSLGKNGELAVVDDPGTDAPGFGPEEPSATKSSVPAPAGATSSEACNLLDPEDCRQKCAQHNVESCTNMAFQLEYGLGVQIFLPQAQSAGLDACELGDPEACLMVGNMFGNPPSGQADLAKASAYWQRACEKGFADGCRRLAFENQPGEPPDAVKARDYVWYAMVAQQLEPWPDDWLTKDAEKVAQRVGIDPHEVRRRVATQFTVVAHRMTPSSRIRNRIEQYQQRVEQEAQQIRQEVQRTQQVLMALAQEGQALALRTDRAGQDQIHTRMDRLRREAMSIQNSAESFLGYMREDAASAPTEQVRIRMADSETAVHKLRERLASPELHLPVPTRVPFSITHRKHLGPDFRLIEIAYSFDGNSLLSKADEAFLNSQDEIPALSSNELPSGFHTIRVNGEVQAKSGQRIHVYVEQQFEVAAQGQTAVTADLVDRGPKQPLDQRPAIAIDVKVH